MIAVRTISPTVARRVAVTKQRLAGPRPAATPDGLLQLLRDIGCIQLDPTRAVAPNHLLVPWSRLGRFDPADLDHLRWDRRALFDYWAHAASIVLTEDYPIHHLRMRTYPRGEYATARRIRAFIEVNPGLRRYIGTELERRGPLATSELEDRAEVGWVSRGWTHGRNVDRMLAFLWMQGKVMVAGRRGQERLWDLADRFLPDWTPRRRLSEPNIVSQSVERSLRGLGVARPRDIEGHFTTGRYPGLARALEKLERQGRIAPVRIEEDGAAWPGTWFVHADDVPLLDEVEPGGGWEPRTTLLSPFDNLIRDRARTELLFGFRFRLEIYVPKNKREYGFFVMPILLGDRLIGRIDPLMDRTRGRLAVNALHLEPGASASKKTGAAVAGAIQDLAVFLGATDIALPAEMPAAWRRSF